MSKIRFRYTKTGKAKYISHLELTATMQRAFLRAGINLKYSEGFNPHPYMSVALPLSVGCESICELIDVGLADENIPDLMTIKLPEGIELLDVYKPDRKFSEIAWIEVNCGIHFENNNNAEIKEKIKQCLLQKSLVIEKKSKRGHKELDIAPYIKDAEFDTREEVIIKAKISAQNPTINPADLIAAIKNVIIPDYAFMKRIEIYDSNMIEFI